MKEFWTAERKIFPSIFRVFTGLVLGIDLISFIPATDVLFNPQFNSFLPETGFISQLAIHSTLFLSAYGIVLTLFILGIGKNLSSFLVFVFHLLMLDLTIPLLTWGDTILKFSLLYFIFVDSFQYLSVHRSKGSISFLSKLAVWSIILHIFLIYLNNAYFKMVDKDWQQGIAVFYSFSQYPGFQESLWYTLLSQGFFTKFITYFIIIQQLTFVPLVIWKKTRGAAILVAVFIHLLMLIQFELWKFELIVILLYGFLLNDQEIKNLLPKWIVQKFIPN